jgi:fructose-1,6-bisphosphatase/inositol monophosphatase family enzyme
VSGDLRELEVEVAALIDRVARTTIVPAQAEVTLLDGSDEPVTEVDLDAEQQLSAGLRVLLPAAAVIGEESAKNDLAVLDALDYPGPVWLVDPVDGTGNYAAGGTDFGTMVALVVDGETQGAWIWSRRDDAIFTAVRGDGVRRNSIRVATRPDGEIRRGQILDRFMEPERSDVIHAAVGSVTLVEPCCCAAVDYPAIVEGRLDFSVYARVRPWDHAAGALLVEESGGHAWCFDGRRYRPARQDGGLVISANATTRRTLEAPIAAAVGPW